MGNLSLTQMVENQDDKEDTSNDADDELDLALTDTLTIAVDDTNADTIADLDWQRNMLFVIADDTTPPDDTITITVPAIIRGLVVFQNTTSFDAIITVSGQSATPFRMAPGARQSFTNDGSDILPIDLGRGKVALPLGALREIASNDIDTLANHGGILTSDSDPSYARVNGATDKALRVTWGASNVDEVQFPPTFMPEDWDETRDVTVHLVAVMSGATDTPTIDVQVFDGVGDTEMGGATGALSNTLQELTITLSAADIAGHPLGFLNIALVPGAHTTDSLHLYAAWVEYERKAV